MDIPGVTGHAPPGNDREGGSFAESLRREGSVGAAPPSHGPVLARSFQAGDLASGLGYMSPDFMPETGEDMLDAIALGKGATDEMRRYEELTRYRR